MSTHNICFYEELEKIIPEYSRLTNPLDVSSQKPDLDTHFLVEKALDIFLFIYKNISCGTH